MTPKDECRLTIRLVVEEPGKATETVTVRVPDRHGPTVRRYVRTLETALLALAGGGPAVAAEALRAVMVTGLERAIREVTRAGRRAAR
jgi:hypothetical protein